MQAYSHRIDCFVGMYSFELETGMTWICFPEAITFASLLFDGVW